jgi:hypothetical protein
MSDPEDLGVRLERQRRRKWWSLLALAVVAGVVTSIAFNLAGAGVMFDAGTIPGWLAVAGAAIYVGTMLFGTFAMRSVSDELEVHNNVWGLAAGGFALLIVYPAWWMLWRGQVAPEPGHEPLFWVMFVSATITYLWKKLR